MVETRRLNLLAGSAFERLSLPDRSLVVALSGGADSAALAWLCVEQGLVIRAIHVNHGLTHSRMLEAAARSIAGSLEIELAIVPTEVPGGASPEGQARRARYAAFAESCSSEEALLTAHTLDDDAETVLINLIRGTGPTGLAGIPPYRPPSVYRPMLEIARSEAREIATLAGLDFVDDPMNEDPGLTRNWIRHVILPQLEQANRHIVEALHRTARLVRLEMDDDPMGAGHAPTLVDGAAVQPRGTLLAMPLSQANRSMMAMLAHVIGRSEVTSDRVERMWSVLMGELGRQELGRGAVVELDGPTLVVRLVEESSSGGDVALVPGLHRVGRVEFEVRSMPGPCLVMPLSRWAAVFPSSVTPLVREDGVVTVGGQEAWIPGEERMPVAWYEPGDLGYLSVVAREGTGWTSSR